MTPVENQSLISRGSGAISALRLRVESLLGGDRLRARVFRGAHGWEWAAFPNKVFVLVGT